MEEKKILAPHPDIELGFERKPVEYFMTFPDNGISGDTGLIFVIPGFGDRADWEYHKDKLRPYLANKYNCIAVGVNYFGAKLYALSQDEIDYQLFDVRGFADAILGMFGVAPQEYAVNNSVDLTVLAGILAARGIRRLGAEFRLFYRNRNDINEYQSFGLLPAIDHIQVLGEILKNYKINRKKLIAFGSSYGGYISLLLGKFVPHTFSAIIDNSGFVKSQIKNIDLVDVYRKPDYLNLNGVDYPKVPCNPWTIIDEASPHYFSDSHRCIRNLLLNEHLANTPTRYNIFHSVEDLLVPIKEKDELVALLRDKKVEVHYKVVRSHDIDGKLFKNLEHGMNASLRGMFDYVTNRDSNSLCKADSFTDFDRESLYEFSCGERSYVFLYTKDFTLEVKMTGSIPCPN